MLGVSPWPGSDLLAPVGNRLSGAWCHLEASGATQQLGQRWRRGGDMAKIHGKTTGKSTINRGLKGNIIYKCWILMVFQQAMVDYWRGKNILPTKSMRIEQRIENIQNCFLPWRMKVVNSIIRMRVTYFQPLNIYIYSYLYNFQEWGIEPPKNVTWLWGFISVHKRELIRHYFGEIDLLGVIISWKGMLLSWASVLVGQVFLHNKQPKVVGAWNGKILHVNNSKWWES